MLGCEGGLVKKIINISFNVQSIEASDLLQEERYTCEDNEHVYARLSIQRDKSKKLKIKNQCYIRLHTRGRLLLKLKKVPCDPSEENNGTQPSTRN